MAPLLLFATGMLCLPACHAGENSGPERDKWQRPAAVMDTLGVRAGDAVADVGCGRGYFAFHLARRVGPQGKVYAEDINGNALDDLRQQAQKQGLTQIEIIHGTPENPKLPAASLDVVLSVNSYHEWRQYDAMLRAIYRALKPGGLLGLIDGTAEPGEPRDTYYLEHRMPEGTERADATRNGFRFLRWEQGFVRTDDRKEFYFLIFAKP